MTRPWTTVERVETDEGALELRQRGPGDFLITVGGRVLMTSAAHRSEDALATLACAAITKDGRPRPRVLVGGLGMGYTLRAALDALPADAQVKVAELNATVAAWCRGPLRALCRDALFDPRVELVIDDVSRTIAAAPPRSLDAIVLDLYEGPHQATQSGADPLYGAAALARSRLALRDGGVLAIWSEEPDRAFEERLGRAGLTMERRRSGHGGRTHVVYLARAIEAAKR